jgi:hypothetical protein
MDYSEQTWIIMLAVTVIALVVNGFVIYHLLRFGSLTAISTRLILYLHVSVFIEHLSDIPTVYHGRAEICNFIEVLFYYGVISNIMSITLLTTV